MKTIDLLFEETQYTIEDVAEQARLEPGRVEAIALGRWTPNPVERRKIAEVFGVATDEISWGHNMDPRNIRYRQYGFKEKPQRIDADTDTDVEQSNDTQENDT